MPPVRFLRCVLGLLLLCSVAIPSRASENLIANPGFEEGAASWSVFVPEESQDKGCEFLISKISPHSGTACAEMKAESFARFAIGPKQLQGSPIVPGDRCRLTFWIRADGTLQEKSSPAFVVRLFFLSAEGRELPGGEALFVGLNGKTTIQSPARKLDLFEFQGEIPKEWTKVEAVFEVPDTFGAARLGRPDFFAQYTMGSVFLDDVSLERVGSDVPLSPSFKKR